MANGDFLSSLIGTESGGNWAAQNSEVGSGGQVGHFGRLQFGQARLEDAKAAGIIPSSMTPSQFMADPAAQQAVEAWHFSDIDKQAANLGLNSYIGQTIGGANITPEAIRAMAHLGGIGGAAKFLKTGGKYNPSDAYGTSLLDYALKHGGANGTALGAINSAAPAPKPGGIMGGIGAGIGNLLGYAGQQAAPIMRGAQTAGQNAMPSIMRSALGSVAARTALIDPAIKNIMTGNRSGALGTPPPATGYGSKGYTTIMAPGGGAKFNNAQGVWMGGLSGPGSVPQAHGGSEIDKHRGEIQKTNGRSFY